MVNLQTQLKSEVGVLAEYISDELSVFIVAENKPDDHPANGGLRLLIMKLIWNVFRMGSDLRIL